MNHNRVSTVVLSLTLALAGLLLLALWMSMPVSQASLVQPLAIAPSEYFPLHIGNQWVYSWTNDVYAPTPISETIVITEQVAGFYTFHAFHNQADGRFWLSSSSGYQWSGYATSGSNPFPLPLYMVLKYLYVPKNLFPASFEVGDVWGGTWQSYTATTTLVSDTATIIAGGYTYTDCIQITTVITHPDPFGAGTRDVWFAPGVGPVKLVYDHNDGSVTIAELQTWSQSRNVYLPLVMQNFETVPPMVLSTYPPDGATGVARNLTNLHIAFSEPMNPDHVSTNYGGLGDFDIGYDASSYTFVFTRTTPGLLLASWTYTVTVNEGETGGFIDLSGNRAPTTYFSFTTEN